MLNGSVSMSVGEPTNLRRGIFFADRTPAFVVAVVHSGFVEFAVEEVIAFPVKIVLAKGAFEWSCAGP